MINRLTFFNGYRSNFGSLNQSQTDGLNFLLQKLDDSTVIDDARHYAYILATIKHETAETYKPIKERGSERYLMSKRYYPYIGFGLVQLTWKWNYKKFGDLLDIDLVGNPELALEPETAWKICELGMTKGLYTGKKLSDYFNSQMTNWVSARKIINGLDCANLIAGYGRKFYDIIDFENKQEKVFEVIPDANKAIAEQENYEGELAKALIE